MSDGARAKPNSHNDANAILSQFSSLYRQLHSDTDFKIKLRDICLVYGIFSLKAEHQQIFSQYFLLVSRQYSAMSIHWVLLLKAVVTHYISASSPRSFIKYELLKVSLLFYINCRESSKSINALVIFHCRRCWWFYALEEFDGIRFIYCASSLLEALDEHISSLYSRRPLQLVVLCHINRARIRDATLWVYNTRFHDERGLTSLEAISLMPHSRTLDFYSQIRCLPPLSHFGDILFSHSKLTFLFRWIIRRILPRFSRTYRFSSLAAQWSELQLAYQYCIELPLAIYIVFSKHFHNESFTRFDTAQNVPFSVN